jgi:hypothetical protein
MKFKGRFEGHLTVSTQDRDAFLAATAPLGLKTVMVELEDAGSNPHKVHLMTTSWHDGTLNRAQKELGVLAQKLTRQGLEVVRTKVEAALTVEGVPKRDTDAKELPGCYFEHHFLLDYPETDPEKSAILRGVCRTHKAYLSRILDQNGFRRWVRYVSLRFRGVGLSTVSQSLKAFQVDLKRTGRKPLKSHSEFAVYDSNPSLDAEWGNIIL